MIKVSVVNLFLVCILRFNQRIILNQIINIPPIPKIKIFNNWTILSLIKTNLSPKIEWVNGWEKLKTKTSSQLVIKLPFK